MNVGVEVRAYRLSGVVSGIAMCFRNQAAQLLRALMLGVALEILIQVEEKARCNVERRRHRIRVSVGAGLSQ